MWAGAKIGKIAVTEQRYRLAFRDVFQNIEFEFTWLLAPTKGPQTAFPCHCESSFSTHFDLFEGLVLLHDLLHLGFDPIEIIQRDPMVEFQIVIKPMLHRGSGGKLSLWPDAENSGS